ARPTGDRDAVSDAEAGSGLFDRLAQLSVADEREVEGDALASERAERLDQEELAFLLVQAPDADELGRAREGAVVRLEERGLDAAAHHVDLRPARVIHPSIELAPAEARDAAYEASVRDLRPERD